MTNDLVALPWVRRVDYDEVRRLMEDCESWPESYDEWLQHAEVTAKQADNQGAKVVRVMIEPYEFDVWCAANDMRKDHLGRMAFAAENAF